MDVTYICDNVIIMILANIIKVLLDRYTYSYILNSNNEK